MAADTTSTPVDPDAGRARTTVGPAEDRITRLFARFLSSGYVAYLFLMAATIVSQADDLALWWTVLAVGLVYGPAVVMGLFSFHPDLRWVRATAAVTALGFVVAAALWPVAWNGELLRADAWISTIPGLAGLSAALVWPPGRTVAVLLAAVIPVQLINHLCRAPGHNGRFVPDLLFAISFCLLFVAAGLMAMRTGRILDATRNEAHAVAAAAAAATARTVQRARFNALLHDWVMSTLLAAARGTQRSEVRHQAELALGKLNDVGSEGAQGFTAVTAAAHIRTAVADVDDRLPVTVREDPDGGDRYFPAEPIQVLGAAVAEAVRNSVIHAGAHAARTVSLRFDEGRITVVVTDDGRGFDPAKVPSHRLGLAVSIVERVRRLPGGEVEVRSRPGAGTRIHLSWRAVER
ncbi:sensor histidine kinase [Nocardia cerradoensis]|uniref:sensor histidine kinase n=1 Tax=Nocardia cerradoensis TaxID=85688 RepID=UPI00030981B0|nr:ATP-binding protein [Nocardia cerradoensis]NKY42115.1 ATP-binding protein [Nocardia cerradoensis]